MKNHLKTKDVLLLALLTAVYFLLYMLSTLIMTPLGILGHSMSPGITGFLGGSVIYFISRKIGKFGQFTIMTLILMAAFALMGGAYLPWLISSTVFALLADLLASRSKDVSVHKLAIANGLLGLGSILGAIIPATFFVTSFRETWLKRGQTAADMEAYIKYSSGVYAILAMVVVFTLCTLGVYVGRAILKKHLKEDNN